MPCRPRQMGVHRAVQGQPCRAWLDCTWPAIGSDQPVCSRTRLYPAPERQPMPRPDRRSTREQCRMNRAEVFEQHRGRLFGIAYRMLGSVMDAEDILQEAFIRWERGAGHRDLGAKSPNTKEETPQAEPNVDSPAAYLTTVVTRLCIDYL